MYLMALYKLIEMEISLTGGSLFLVIISIELRLNNNDDDSKYEKD